MKIRSVIETEDGDVEFRGTLNPQEIKLVFSAGLNTIYKLGALPFVKDSHKIVIERDTEEANDA